MANLIPESLRQQIYSAFDDMHDTFAIPIYLYKIKDKVLVATNPQYNAMYETAANQSRVVKEKTRIEAMARVWYKKDQEEKYLNSDSQAQIPISAGDVRIKAKDDIINLISQSSEVEINGQMFKKDTDSAKPGNWQPNYSILYLRRKNG